jgi:hypothetical protein
VISILVISAFQRAGMKPCATRSRETAQFIDLHKVGALYMRLGSMQAGAAEQLWGYIVYVNVINDFLTMSRGCLVLAAIQLLIVSQ